MAIYHEDIIDVELQTGNIFRSFLQHSIGLADAAANRFGVRIFRNGEAETLSGVTCQAFFHNANGENIALTSYGTVSGNTAYVTLPQACYNVEGRFTLAIKLVGSGVTSTMRIVDGVVDNTNTGGAVAPTGSVPTYQEVLSVYSQMQAALDDYADVVATQNGQIDDLKDGLDYLENVVLSEKRIITDYVTGRYFPNGFNPVNTFARNDKALPAGNYVMSAYSVPHVVVGYISDTQGEAIVAYYVTGKTSFTADKPFYISFSKSTAFTDADLEDIKENFVLTRIYDTDETSIESKLSTAISKEPEVLNLLSEVYILNSSNNNVRRAVFTDGVGNIAIGDSTDWCCYRVFTADAPAELNTVYEIPSYGNSNATAFVVFKSLNASFSGTLNFTDAVYQLYKMPTIEEYFVNGFIDVEKTVKPSTQEIVFLGDSIFGMERGNTSIPSLVGEYTGATTHNCALGGTEGNSHGDSTFKWFDFTELSTAISNGDYTNQRAHLSDTGVPAYFANVITELESIDFSTVDLICVTYGGNDYGNSHTDTDAFVNAMVSNINRILTAFPNIRFMLMNPPYKMFLDSTTHAYVSDGDTQQNSFGKTLRDYAEAYKTISESVHTPYINAYDDLGINRYNASQWFIVNDGSHPSEQGRKETAKLVSEFLKRMLYD